MPHNEAKPVRCATLPGSCTEDYFCVVAAVALAIRFSFPIWRTVSSAGRNGTLKKDLGAMPVMVGLGPVARIVPDLDTESTALDNAVPRDEARGMRVSVAFSEQS